MTAVCAWVTRHGRLVLLGGLVAGFALPGLARALVPMILPLITALLFLAALRVDPLAAFPARRMLPRFLALTLVLQTALPLAAIAGLAAVGALGTMAGIGAVLVLAAAPITGSPGLAVLSGADPAPALRQLVLGTALLPLSVVPVFWLMPVFGAPEAVAAAALRLFAIIAVAGGAGALLRRVWPAVRAPGGQAAVDAATVLAMAAVVIALMSAVGPAVLSGDGRLWAVLGTVVAINFGSQAAVFLALGRSGEAAALAIAAGNRNLALFLGALPPDLVTGLLLFVGVYQVPMYLTPLVVAPVLRAWTRPGSGVGPGPGR